MITPNDFPDHHGYDNFPTTLPPYLGAILFETFLYGLYTILFAICIYVLLRRRNGSGALHWFFLFSAVVMYAIATADMSYTYYLLFGKLLKDGLSFQDLRPKYWLYVTNNVIADILLLYRCYVVWGHKKRIIVGPALLLLAGTICGYLFEGSSTALFSQAWVYLVLTFALNVILTALAAGRVWYMSRQGKKILGPGLLQRYQSAVGLLIESGSIYSVYIVLDLAFHTNSSGSTVLDSGLVQIVGIMPTLIIVQVGLERAVHNIQAREYDNTNNNEGVIEIPRAGTSEQQSPTSPRSGHFFSQSFPEFRRHDAREHGDGSLHGYAKRASGSKTSVRTTRSQMMQADALDDHDLAGEAGGRIGCTCGGPCSASSETFVVRDHYLQQHSPHRTYQPYLHHRRNDSEVEDQRRLREQTDEAYDGLERPNVGEMEYVGESGESGKGGDARCVSEMPDPERRGVFLDEPEMWLARSETGLVCAELSERLDREHAGERAAV